jgi:hypothetical protein
LIFLSLYNFIFLYFIFLYFYIYIFIFLYLYIFYFLSWRNLSLWTIQFLFIALSNSFIIIPASSDLRKSQAMAVVLLRLRGGGRQRGCPEEDPRWRRPAMTVGLQRGWCLGWCPGWRRLPRRRRRSSPWSLRATLASASDSVHSSCAHSPSASPSLSFQANDGVRDFASDGSERMECLRAPFAGWSGGEFTKLKQSIKQRFETCVKKSRMK